jgi:hypothetical protein
METRTFRNISVISSTVDLFEDGLMIGQVGKSENVEALSLGCFQARDVFDGQEYVFESHELRNAVMEEYGGFQFATTRTGADTSLLEKGSLYAGYKRHWQAELFNPEAIEQR